jgi:hypothetical protein
MHANNEAVGACGCADAITESPRITPVAGTFDVLVAGAGPAGLGAALGAARAGARVAIVERHGCLGGMLTAGGVQNIRQFTDRERRIIGGPAVELVHRIHDAGGTRESPETGTRVMQEPEVTKFVAQEMLLEAGVVPHLHTWIATAIVEAERVRGLIVEAKSGRRALLAGVTVDATGDGDVIARAGAAFDCDPENLQPMTLAFILSHVDAWPEGIGAEMAGKIRQAIEAGEFPCERVPSIFARPRSGEYYVNGTRIPGDCTNAEELTRCEIEGRRQVMGVVDWLRKHAPGYANACLHSTAQQVGLRESRRLRGCYALTREDVLDCRDFDDRIARGGYGIDIHYPGRGGEMTWPPIGQSYAIPYRCLVPETMEGLLAAGRCLSATREALGAVRVMAIAMATGHAAGVAAALAVRRNCTPREVPIAEIQSELRRQEAILEHPAGHTT